MVPKVSIIIPTYNRVEFLAISVNSVLNQTFTDFELIISDDASTDNTRQYVKSISDPRVKYICNDKNLGIAATRNNALTSSEGQYIAFLDDDDEWFEDKLTLQIDKIKECPPQTGGIYSGVKYLDVEREKITFVSVPKIRGKILNSLLSENFLVTSALLLKKECFQKIGQFDTAFRSASDFDMWIRIACEYEFDYIEKPLIKYKVHNNKITNDNEAVIYSIKLLLSKHKNLYSRHRAAYSSYTCKLGIFYLYDGQLQKARKAFARAIILYPFNLMYYYNFVLSIFGRNAYIKAKSYRSRLMEVLRSSFQSEKKK